MLAQMYTLFLAESASGRMPWWVWLILIIILLVLLWFWFGREEETESVGEASIVETGKAEKAVDSAHEPATPPSIKPDDLKTIEGIGPKVASLLNEAGITTFQQLAYADVKELNTILDQAGLQMMDAKTWPEQAKLASDRDWDGLKKLQDELKGGKRV